MSGRNTTYKDQTVTLETKAYLDDLKKEIMGAYKEANTQLENHLKELIEKTITPMEKDIDRHRSDITDLYDKDRAQRERVSNLETRIGIVEKQQEEEKRIDDKKPQQAGNYIAVGSIAIGLLLALVGFLI